MTRLLRHALAASTLIGVLAACSSGTGTTSRATPGPSPTAHVVEGTDGPDRLTGTPGDDDITGGESGSGDVIRGLGGDDTIRLVNGGSVDAGPGDDTVHGVYLFEPSRIDCGPGEDHLYLTDTTAPNVRVSGCETVTTTPVN